MSSFERLRSGSVKNAGTGALFASSRAISHGYVDESKLEIGGLPGRSAAEAEVRPGDVLVVLRGPVNAAAALSIPLPEPLFATLELAIIRPHETINAEYLAWFINQPTTQRALSEMRLGGSVERLPLAALDGLTLPIAPLEVQLSIAAIATLAREQAELSDRLARLRTIQLQTALLAVANTHTLERPAHARG